MTKQEGWIDIHNEDLMRKAGLRFSKLKEPRDESVWTKTNKEREAIRKAKSRCKYKDGHFHTIPIKQSYLYDKLIITLKKSKKNVKQVISTKCWEHEIPYILSKYNNVLKYSWNGVCTYMK